MNKLKKLINTTDEMMKKLRDEAEKIIELQIRNGNITLQQPDIKELLHQIQVQQVELEMQNDELLISNEELESQRQKFTGLYDLAPVGYFILNDSGIIEDVNSVGISLLDTGKKFIVNRRFQNFITPEDNDLFYGFLRRVIHSKTKQSCQITFVNKKKKIIYAQIEGIAIYNSSGKQNQCYLAVIDLTERKEAELKLFETKERLEMALNASNAGTWQFNVQSGKIHLDNFSCDIFGLEEISFEDEMAAFINMIHPHDREKVRKEFIEAIEHKKDLDVEYRILKSGNRVAYITARGHVIIKEKGLHLFLGMIIDVTERKKLEQVAHKLKVNQQRSIMAAILQTQENERKRISESLHDSVSQLLYGIKLKLRNVDKNLTSDPIFSDVYQLLDMAINETRNISFELAPSILEDFGLPVTLDTMAKRLKTDKLSISTKVTGLNKRFPLAIETSLFRIIQELLNNAIKHAAASKINIELVNKNTVLLISVTDNGIGFNTNKIIEASGGSGLQSIKNRLNLLGGTMQIESRETGTSVKISLPNLA